jgi:26S proteasome regulatory subunit N8
LIIDKINGLKALAGKLKEMRLYMEGVINGKYRYNQMIIQNFQDIFNLLPNLQIDEMIKSFSVKTNDYMYILYVSSLIKSVISLHSLINNKIHNKELEQEIIQKEKDAEEEKKKKQEESAKKAEDLLNKEGSAADAPEKDKADKK